MAGYSGTPLTKKLGIKESFRVVLLNEPKGFGRELEDLPPELRFLTRQSKQLDLILLFAKSQAALRRDFPKMTRKLVPNGMFWVAWPKKSSAVVTDLTENDVRRIGLAAGLVDVKICAINDVWSGLKFVYRLQDRASISDTF
jgi:hypothetical protein